MATMDPGQRRAATKKDAFKKWQSTWKPPKKIAPRIPRPRPPKGKLPWPLPPRRKRPGLEKLPYPLPKRKK